MSKDLITKGDSVVIRLHDEKSCYILRAEGDQKIGKTRVYVKNMLGAPYGSIFEINDRHLKDVTTEPGNEEIFNPELYQPDQERGDNRGYVDSNTAQKLTNSDVQRMRSEGATSTDIIKSLISNSETWAAKTVFAQEKWVKKKTQKHAKRFRVIKTTPATICEVYNSKSRDKICGLRVDTLAQILYQSSVHAGSRVLVFESTIGLIVGSVAYLLRGRGRILGVYDGQQPHNEIVDHLNLTSSDEDVIQPVPSVELAAAVDYVRENGFCNDFDIDMTPSSVTKMDVFNPDDESEIVCVAGAALVCSAEAEESSAQAITRKRSAPEPVSERERKPLLDRYGNPVKRHHMSGRQPKDRQRIQQLLRAGSNSLIIASRYHPLPILRECLSLLGPCSPFVVYSEFMEPLSECYLYLQERGDCLRLKLSDTWLREYQTLPGRMHPQMYMPTTGGYLLTGIYVGMIEQTAS